MAKDGRLPFDPRLERVRSRMVDRLRASITWGVLSEVQPRTIENPAGAATFAAHCLLDYSEGQDLILLAADLIREGRVGG